MIRSSQQPQRGAGYQALACDGDGTLMSRKRMAQATVAALARLRASGRKLVLATGEDPGELAKFPHLDLFDLVVAENGAILCWPRTKKVRLLTGPPPPQFVRRLRRRRVIPLSRGRVIVCTKRPYEREVGEVIHELGLAWQVVFNRDQVMALPMGVDKATGMAAAAAELGLSAAEVVGVGDGENDLPLLRYCGCGVAVASAVPALKAHADLVTEGGAGRGVVELIRRLIAGDVPVTRK